MCINRAVRKSGAFHIPIKKKKNRVSHILFAEKNGAHHIPDSAEKGGRSHNENTPIQIC